MSPLTKRSSCNTCQDLTWALDFDMQTPLSRLCQAGLARGCCSLGSRLEHTALQTAPTCSQGRPQRCLAPSQQNLKDCNALSQIVRSSEIWIISFPVLQARSGRTVGSFAPLVRLAWIMQRTPSRSTCSGLAWHRMGTPSRLSPLLNQSHSYFIAAEFCCTPFRRRAALHKGWRLRAWSSDEVQNMTMP